MQAKAILVYGISTALGKTFIAMDLPGVVDLNKELGEVFKSHFDNNFDTSLGMMETAVLESAPIKMHPILCAGEEVAKHCGAVSAGVSRQNLMARMNKSTSEILESHNKRINISDAILFDLGTTQAANQLIDQGVDFVSITTLTAPKCDIFTSRAFEFPKPEYYRMQPESLSAEFQKVWKKFVSSINKLDSLSSKKFDKVSLSNPHKESIKRTIANAQMLVENYYGDHCLPKAKLVATACKSTRAHIIYGSSNTIISDFQKDINQVILANIANPGEFFSVLVSCGTIPVKMFYM